MIHRAKSHLLWGNAEDLLLYCVYTLDTDSFLSANTWTNAVVLCTVHGPIRGGLPNWR